MNNNLHIPNFQTTSQILLGNSNFFSEIKNATSILQEDEESPSMTSKKWGMRSEGVGKKTQKKRWIIPRFYDVKC